MSQAGKYASLNAPIETLTGNTGGPVPPTAGNINILGTGFLTVAGNPATSTLTISDNGTVATTYTEDSGTATPAANNLNVLGGTAGRDINTSGSGSTIHINLNNAITLGDLSNIVGSAALTLTTGDATISAGNINLHNTTSNSLEGMIVYAGFRFMNNFGDRSTWLGTNSGNPGGITTAADNTGIGYNTLTAITSGNSNTAVGSKALQAATTSLGNTCIGYNAGTSIISTGENTAIGYQALQTLSTGTGTNIAIGSQCMRDVTLGIFNIAIGNSALLSTTSGGYNICLGLNSGRNYTSTESSNIIIASDPANTGVLGESNVIRIGSPGSGNGQQNKCFIAGIDGVNVGSVAKVVTENNNQLGTATITAGTGITVTPGANTITISTSGLTNLTYTNVNTSPYVVLTTDEYISVDCSGGAITIQFPNTATSGRAYVVKDRTGSAATHNITVTTVGGAVNIDGATTFVMNTNFQSINIIGNGTTYEIY